MGPANARLAAVEADLQRARSRLREIERLRYERQSQLDEVCLIGESIGLESTDPIDLMDEAEKLLRQAAKSIADLRNLRIDGESLTLTLGRAQEAEVARTAARIGSRAFGFVGPRARSC